jgi:energy-coupling factor transport system substrate-specific component
VWPFLAGESALHWDPAAGAVTNLHHYLTYYGATSFVWDTFRAVGNAALVLALGRPLLGSLDRASRRMRLDVHEAEPAT